MASQVKQMDLSLQYYVITLSIYLSLPPHDQPIDRDHARALSFYDQRIDLSLGNAIDVRDLRKVADGFGERRAIAAGHAALSLYSCGSEASGG